MRAFVFGVLGAALFLPLGAHAQEALPDLVITGTDLYYNVDQDRVEGTVTVRNTGVADAFTPYSSVGLWIDLNGHIDEYGWAALPADRATQLFLRAGESRDIELPAGIKSSQLTRGDNVIDLRIDDAFGAANKFLMPGGYVREANEDNNAFRVGIEIGPSAPRSCRGDACPGVCPEAVCQLNTLNKELPDLTVESLSFKADENGVGVVRFEVVNKGKGDAAGWFSTLITVNGRPARHVFYLQSMKQNGETVPVPIPPEARYLFSVSGFEKLIGTDAIVRVQADSFNKILDTDGKASRTIGHDMIRELDERNNWASVRVNKQRIPLKNPNPRTGLSGGDPASLCTRVYFIARPRVGGSKRVLVPCD